MNRLNKKWSAVLFRLFCVFLASKRSLLSEFIVNTAGVKCVTAVKRPAVLYFSVVYIFNLWAHSVSSFGYTEYRSTLG